LYYDTKLIFSPILTHSGFSSLYWDMKLSLYYDTKLSQYCDTKMSLYCDTKLSLYYEKKLILFLVLRYEISFRPCTVHEIGFRSCTVTRNCPCTVTRNCPCNVTQNFPYDIKLVFISVLWHKNDFRPWTLTKKLFSPFFIQKIGFRCCTMTQNWFSSLYYDTYLVFVHELLSSWTKNQLVDFLELFTLLPIFAKILWKQFTFILFWPHILTNLLLLFL